MTHGFFRSGKKRLKLSPDSESGVFSMLSTMKKHASPATWIAAAAITEAVAALTATAMIMTAMPRRVIILTLSFFMD